MIIDALTYVCISNHPDTVVFKMKDHMFADITSAVFDEMLKSFWDNDVCEAMHIQNISSAFKDQQLRNLILLLREKKIWCLNISEISHVSSKGWVEFCDALPSTNISHLYVSEHIIPLSLQIKIRDHVRLESLLPFLPPSLCRLCTHSLTNSLPSLSLAKQRKLQKATNYDRGPCPVREGGGFSAGWEMGTRDGI